MAGVGALVVGSLVLMPTLSSADGVDHGTRIVGGRGVQRTTAELAGASHGREPHRAWPARGSGVAKTQSPDALPVRIPGVRQTSPRVAVTNPLTFDGPALENSVTPPDTQGDIGTTQFFITLNTRFKTFTRAGSADGVVDESGDDFFAGEMSPLPPAPRNCNFTSDPHVRFDRLAQRWFIVMIDVPGCDGASANRVMIAVSDGPTITAGTVWTFFHIDAPAGTLADYPTLGIDANALYIGVNDFATTTGSFTASAGYVLRKSSLLGGGPIVSTRFVLAAGSGSGPFTPQGVDDPYDADAHGHFVGVDNAAFGKLDVVTVTNPGGSPTVSTAPLSISSTNFPVPVPHLGNTVGSNGRLDALDDRLFAATMTADGHIWTAHNVGVNSVGGSTSPTRDASRWYEISPGTPVLVQSGTIFDNAATSPVSFWIPTVAVSGQAVMAIGGSAASAGTHADAWYAARLPTDPAGTTDVPARYTASAFSYNPAFDPGTASGRRWGDYSLTRVDPNDNQTLWTIQEYVNATDSWGVKVAKLRAPGPATPAATSAPVPQGATSTHVTLTGTASGGSGWYDPGAAFPQRLGVTIGCGVQVNSVQVVSPTELDLDLDTTGSSLGACSVTTTNPDGQQTTGTDALVVVRYQPDGLLKPTASASFIGDNVYDLTGAGQSVTAPTAHGATQQFDIGVQNDGTTPDNFVLTGAGSAGGITAHYYSGTTDITSAVVAGTFDTGSLDPGAAASYRLTLTVGASAPTGSIRSWPVTARSVHQSTKADVVKPGVKVTGYQPDGMIRTRSSVFVGNNVYNTTGTNQAAKAKTRRTKKAVFYLKVQNDGTFTDTFRLKGPGKKPGVAVTYLAGSTGTTTITSAVTHGTYTLTNLAPGTTRVIRLVVKVKRGASIGAQRSWLITATSTHDGTRKDAVLAKIKVIRG